MNIKKDFGVVTWMFFSLIFSTLVLSASITSGAVDDETTSMLSHVRSSEKDGIVTVEADVLDPGAGEILEKENDSSLIMVEGCGVAGQPGEPMLPTCTYNFLLSPGANLKHVSVALIDPSFKAASEGELDLGPAQPAVYREGGEEVFLWGDKDPVTIKNGRDIRIYKRDAFYPENMLTLSSTGQLRDWKIVTVSLRLARYNPVEKYAELLTGGRVVVTAPIDAGTSATVSLSSSSVQSSQIRELQRNLVNKGDLSRFYDLHSQEMSTMDAAVLPKRLAIITTEEIVRNTPHLPNYMNFKRSKGYEVRLVTEGGQQTADHYASAGAPLQRAINIRNWLVAHINEIDAVLLIGDPRYDQMGADASVSVPMLYSYPYRTDSGEWFQVATDMFYADLTGNWDLNGDGRYGEYYGDFTAGGADQWGELHVGRIPFYGSYDALRLILFRFMNYADMDETQTGYRDKVLISAAISNFAPRDKNGDGDTNDAGDISDPNAKTYGDMWGERLRELSNFYGRDTRTFYEKEGHDHSTTACDLPLNKANLISEWQAGAVYSTWNAHGGSSTASRVIWYNDSSPSDGICNTPFEKRSVNFFEHTDAFRLPHYRPGFAVNLSCYNGNPDESHNLGTTLLQTWAVGTVTASRVSIYGFGSWSLADLDNGNNRSIGYHLYEAMEVDSSTLAGALNVARSSINFSINTRAAWNNVLCYNMYGDPTLTFSSGYLPGEGRLSLESPNGHEEYLVGEIIPVTWTSENISGNVYIDISIDGGYTWQNVIPDTPNDGYQGVVAPSELSETCRIRIRSEAPQTFRDLSVYHFSISNPPIPQIPTELVASDGAFTDRVRLTWNHVAHAQTYKIYRTVGDGTIYQYLGVSLLTSEFSDRTANQGVTYRYYVRAVNAIGETSGPSNTDTGFITLALPFPSIPTEVSASDGSYVDKVRISWNQSDGTSLYRISRAVVTGGLTMYEEIGTSTAPYFDDVSAEQAVTYSYRVMATNFLFSSNYSATDTGFVTLVINIPTPPAGLTASDGTFPDKVSLTWNPVANSTGYTIYRANTSYGLLLYQQIGATVSATFDDTTAILGETYSYKVSSYNMFSESGLSTGDTGFAAENNVVPDIPTDVVASDGAYDDHINISWSPSANALFYHIFRGVVTDGVIMYQEIDDISATSYDDYAVFDNLTYIYKVKAVNNFGDTAFSTTDTGQVLSQAGDIDNNNTVDLKDAILSLQVVVGAVATETYINKSGDVDDDYRIGLEEAIYILQGVSK